MSRDWQELIRFAHGVPATIEKVRLADGDIAIEGSFEVPPLARLSAEDQVFVMAFVRSHGSIKEMEQVFGISYPTVKNRLNRISENFQFVETVPVSSQTDVLVQLENGEISVNEAIERMSK